MINASKLLARADELGWSVKDLAEAVGSKTPEDFLVELISSGFGTDSLQTLQDILKFENPSEVFFENWPNA